jgi:hypothetical protein
MALAAQAEQMTFMRITLSDYFWPIAEVYP